MLYIEEQTARNNPHRYPNKFGVTITPYAQHDTIT